MIQRVFSKLSLVNLISKGANIVKENTSRVSFDIKFTRQGFENACLISRLVEAFDLRSRS